MARTYNMHDAKTHLSRLAERASQGEEIVIARNGRPLAKLGPVDKRRSREFGFWEGQVRIRADFDDPLPSEIQKHFEGDGD